MWRGRLTLRKTATRIAGLLLDRTTWIARAIAPTESRWGEIEHMLADGMDLYASTHDVKFMNGAPWHYRRPGEAEQAESRLEARKRKFDERQKNSAHAIRLDTEGGD